MPSTSPPPKREHAHHKRPDDPNDPHYPRPGWFRAVRAVLEALWVVGILGYAGNSIWSLIGVFTNSGEVTAQAIFDALYIGRLYTLAGTNPLAAGAIVTGIGGLTLLAYLARRDSLREKVVLAGRAEYEKLAAYYTLKPVRELDAQDPFRDGIQLARYVPDVYLKRRDSAGADAESEARRALAAVRESGTPDAPGAPLGILITGRPTLGKTRFAWEAMRATLPHALFVNWPGGGAPEFDFTLTAGKTVALWLDNLQDYAKSDLIVPTLNALPARFGASRLIVVATSRDGPDLEAVTDKLAPLTRRLTAIPLADITPTESDALAGELEREGQQVDRAAADGTPGALLLDVAAMRDQRYPALPDGAQAVLKAMKLLRAAGAYDYPARRVGAVARGVFTLGAGRGVWDAAVDALVRSDFVRLGRAVDDAGLRALEPVADVYLERAVKDYPAGGAAITDQWPALQDVLTREHDTYALWSLGSSYNGLRIGLDSAMSYDLRSARQRAEQCFREVLALLPADDPDRPGAQNNLGVALRAQARLATGAEQRRLLGEAVDAYRAALGASTPGTPDWANAQNNLGVALSAQAGLATGAEQRRLLGEAVDAYRQALTVRTRRHDPNGWAETQFNVALLLVDRANLTAEDGDSGQVCSDLREALHAVVGAEEIFGQGSPTYLGFAVELRKHIEAGLAELGCAPE